MKKGIRKITVIIVILFTLILLSAINKFRNEYSYHSVKIPIEKKYKFTNCNEFQVELIDNKFGLPDNISEYDTAILKIDLSVSNLWFHDPFIEMKRAGVVVRQYLEPGYNGVNYLNFSNLLTLNSPFIELLMEKVEFNDSQVELLLFKNEISQKKILIFSPHPDDAEIAAYGLYREFNEQTYVVNITSGNAGFKRYEKDDKSYKLKGEIRSFESVQLPQFAGIPAINNINLGYPNSMLKKMHDNPENIVSGYDGLQDTENYRKYNKSDMVAKSSKNSYRELLNDLKEIINELEPEVIVLPDTTLDYHIDHKYTTVAVFDALKELKMKKGKLFFYTNHAVTSDFYPYGSSEGVIGLAPTGPNAIEYDGIFSFALNDNVCLEKFVILQQESDLRNLSDADAYKIFKNQNKMFDNVMQIYYSVMGVWGFRNRSYQRRATRPNEVFYVWNVNRLYEGKQ